MTNLSVFEFDSKGVRIVIREGNPWFVAKDICLILEIKNVADALTRLDDDEKGIVSTDTPGGKQDTAIVSESGMYALVLGSRKLQAKAFRKWITSEVLPTLREKGTYSIETQVPDRPVLGAYIERVKTMYDNARNIPEGYWCVLHEASGLLVYVESVLKLPVDKTDLLDGSIGRTWSNYRKGKEWAGNSLKFSYQFPDGRWCDPLCYEYKELEQFRLWLDRQYKTQLMPKYLYSKYGAIVTIK
ncbi:BRO family protein [Microcoleus sp. herbarium7]|uniref:BRO-N domain-containing protein n=1 Tax=Microcoleus sp. herbarium7 TaxID=3055435 RepID=UPI002FD76F59